jgi:hypothetical protein
MNIEEKFATLPFDPKEIRTINSFSESDLQIINSILEADKDYILCGLELKDMLQYYLEHPQEQLSLDWTFNILRESLMFLAKKKQQLILNKQEVKDISLCDDKI